MSDRRTRRGIQGFFERMISHPSLAMHRLFCVTFLSLCGVVVAMAADNASHLGNRYLGPSDILVADDPNELLILELDARQLRNIPIDGELAPRVLNLPIRPERMSLFPDKKHLAIVGNGPLGKLLIVNLETLSIEKTIAVGHSPSHVAVFQETVYVANRFDGTVSVVDIKEGRETARWQAGREPIALAVTPDGRQLVVAGQLPEDASLNPDTAARIRIFDTKTGDVTMVRLRQGSMNLRDVALSTDGRYAFVTGIVGHFEQIPSQVSGGWMNENVVFVIDIHAGESANIFYIDDYGMGGGNPWGISLADDGRFLIVAHAGSCEISLLTMRKVLDILDSRPGSKGMSQRPPIPDTDATLPMQLRIPVGLKGVRHAVMSKGRIFATAYFEDSVLKVQPELDEPVPFVPGLVIGLDTLDWESERSRKRPEIKVAENGPLHFVELPRYDLMKGANFRRCFARLGPQPVWNAIRSGEMLFHDAAVCFEHWQSCSTCHPDGRSDTLNWDLLNDGQGNPKNTKSMLLSHETPPSMATGVRKDAELAVRKGFESILFITVPETEACDVDAYLTSLLPVPSPYLVYAADGSTSLSESAKRGKRLFDGAAGCAVCHPAPLFTDMKKHDVGTRSVGDFEPFYDTPTLIEVWRTAPYLHDGRYPTMKELIVDGKHVDTNGQLGKLSEAEIDDLIEYVLSL